MFGDNFLYSLCLLPPDSSLLMICLKGMKNHTQFAFESLHLFLFFMAYLKKKKKTQPKFSVLAMAKLFKSNLLDLSVSENGNFRGIRSNKSRQIIYLTFLADVFLIITLLARY